MMDALGFKAASREHPGELLEKMHGLLKSAGWVENLGQRLNQDGFSEVPQVTFLSDTIAIGLPIMVEARLQKTDIEHAVHALSLASALAGSLILKAGLAPLPMAYRGCVSFGEYEMNETFILGPAVNDAAEHYELAECAAVWLTPTALTIWNEGAPLADESTSRAMHPCAIPLKSGAVFESVAVNPFYNHTLPTAAERKSWIQSILSTFRGPISVHVKRQATAKLLATFDEALPVQ